MRYSAEIESKIIAQVQAEPEREVILPGWAYGSGETQPFVYVKGKQVRLSRLLYERLIQPLPYEAGIKPRPGVDPRNVNPHLFAVTATRDTRLVCPNNHEYTEADMTPRGNRCRKCHELKLLGTPSVADINSAKSHCPMNHEYTRENTIRLKSGRRRCRICHRETVARYRARQKETDQ